MTNQRQGHLTLGTAWGDHRWIAVVLASLFFLASLGFSIWAFTLDCLRPHQQDILHHYLPVFTALAATFLGGTILVSPRAGNPYWAYGIAAGGGIAIWLLLFLFAPRSLVPCGVGSIRIIEHGFLREDLLKGSKSERSIVRVEPRANNSIDFPSTAHVSVLLFALAEVDDSILSIHGSKLVAKAKVWFGSGQAEATTVDALIWELTSVQGWRNRPLLVRTGIRKIEHFIANAQKSTPKGKSIVPIIAELGCMDPKEWPGGAGKVEISVELHIPTPKATVQLPFVSNIGGPAEKGATCPFI